MKIRTIDVTNPISDSYDSKNTDKVKASMSIVVGCDSAEEFQLIKAKLEDIWFKLFADIVRAVETSKVEGKIEEDTP